MRSVRTRSEPSILGLPSLFFIYVLLGILGVFFSSTFFADALRDEHKTTPVFLLIFLTIPIVLLTFLSASVLRLARDVSRKRAGGKLRARLLIYFTATAVLASAPATIITARFIGELLQSWYSANLEMALGDARWFALDAYRYRLSALSKAISSKAGERALALAEKGDETGASAILTATDEAYESIQEFRLNPDKTWTAAGFAGNRKNTLDSPPALRNGFLPRESTRDRDVTRYIVAPDAKTVRVITFSLGTDFDLRVERIETAIRRIGAIAKLEPKLGWTLFLLYAAFSLPTILMAVIIAFSLSNAVTQPIVSLAEATRRVADGDFSIRILSRPGDELSALVSSFNSMVRDLESSRSATLRAEKINVWQDMAQRLAHEIKNPLTPIKLSAERILRRWKTEPERLAEILEPCVLAIVREVDGLSSMLTEFREFARLPPPTLSWTNVKDLVEKAVALYRSSYPNVTFDYAEINPQLSVKLDQRHISQGLANLILNAIDAMSGSGRIEFRADLVKKRDSRYCRLSVRDNGKGIPEKDRQHIFTPYYTTKDAGTGLGLSIVERIVTDHGGTIWFDSAEGVGTTFYIDFPIDRSEVTAIKGVSNP